MVVTKLGSSESDEKSEVLPLKVAHLHVRELLHCLNELLIVLGVVFVHARHPTLGICVHYPMDHAALSEIIAVLAVLRERVCHIRRAHR